MHWVGAWLQDNNFNKMENLVGTFRIVNQLIPSQKDSLADATDFYETFPIRNVLRIYAVAIE